MPSAAVGAWLLLLRVGSDVFARHEAYISKHGHSQGRFTTLMLLHYVDCNDGPQTPSVLAERAGLSRAAMTTIIDSLEAEGLVTRRQSADDRRRQEIALTERGSSHVEALLPGHIEDIRASMGGLGDEQLDQLMTLLDALRRAMDPLAPTQGHDPQTAIVQEES
ncbi:MAG: MarR family transcriptional regulator [Planctomycetota bacterium]